MQLNNLVIIPIPSLSHQTLSNCDSQPPSPCKSFNKTTSYRDDITWKKSLSAFKKFKGKKDKETKSSKNSQSNLPFI